MKNITISIQKSKREKRNLGSPRNFWEIFPKGTTTLNKNSIISIKKNYSSSIKYLYIFITISNKKHIIMPIISFEIKQRNKQKVSKKKLYLNNYLYKILRVSITFKPEYVNIKKHLNLEHSIIVKKKKNDRKIHFPFFFLHIYSNYYFVTHSDTKLISLFA